MLAHALMLHPFWKCGKVGTTFLKQNTPNCKNNYWKIEMGNFATHVLGCRHIMVFSFGEAYWNGPNVALRTFTSNIHESTK